MVKVCYYLKSPSSSAPTPLVMQICYKGAKIKLHISVLIDPENWDFKLYRLKKSRSNSEYFEINTMLDKLEQFVKNEYRRCFNDTGRYPKPNKLKEILKEYLRGGESKHNSFFDFIGDLISRSENGSRRYGKGGKRIHKNTVKTYRTTEKHLRGYEMNRKADLSFDSIDKRFYDDFVKYLGDTLCLSVNTIGKQIANLKTFMSEAFELGLHSNPSYRSSWFIAIREESTSIFLTDDEIIDLLNIDLTHNKRLELVRDLFVIGCYTGLRFSDYSNLSRDNIIGGNLVVTTYKTGKVVTIPIHPAVQAIFDKYNGVLPAGISNQKSNAYLKEIGQLLPALREKVTTTITKGAIKHTERKARWQMLSTHTARRSFATNAYKRNIPTMTIMAITGHTTEKSFGKYIKVTETEHAEIFRKHWEVSENGMVQTNGILN